MIRASVIILALLTGPVGAQTQPLSASDWLSGSVRAPVRESSAWRPVPRPPERPAPRQPVAASGAVGPVTVTRLDRVNADTVGTMTARRAGLPPDLWQGSDPDDVARLIRQTPARLGAMQYLLRRVLTAQLPPPEMGSETGANGGLFLARADRLLDMGALDQAQALLLSAGPAEPETFRRLFDIALLEGDEARACAIMNDTPGIAPSFAARIFCLAQGGDWAAAAITLNGAESLGLIDDQQALLMTHFLDDAYVDTGTHLDPSGPMTPLQFRLHEAIGQPLPTMPLPIAFAQSDLRMNGGYKARLEAAERLARAGAIPPDRLRQIYGEQRPAASGGVWERAGAMRTLEAGLTSGDVSQALPRAFDEFRRAGMAGVLAGMVAADLPPDTDGRAGDITRMLRQWVGLKATATTPPLPIPEAIPPDTRKGQALLAAMADIDAAIDGDMHRAARGIAMLRALGLKPDADRAAAQVRLLPQMNDGM
ncbi:hypothetical protein [Paracoccus sp. (in: a-proteobacteria)]|uniref:hypothetical protein n=1 Tax=Paracoccus sp. TaxID=267 RepID=UPI0026E0C3F4|nr:hypothetical protein [Paracoccus sp. (in: a-proteobacteria)]MDO5648931.1 hypothetical protein [Paracoccus sp. (in: a-proteobacteria)]